MQNTTTRYCPKDGTELHIVAQHKGRGIGLLTVFENCPKCGHWLTFTAESVDYIPVFVSCYLLPDELPASKQKALTDARHARDRAAGRGSSHLRIAA